MRTRILFVGLSVVLLGLVGWAAFKDSSSRTYITIQAQYLKDYPSSDFNVQVQQLFPAFPQATIETSSNTSRMPSSWRLNIT
jgi:hypothetical protein